MKGLVEQLRGVVVRGELDLTELEEGYVDEEGEPLRLPFRLNWTRGQKERQRELQGETVELQRLYVKLKGLVEDAEAWRKAKGEADRASEENWRHWAEWWAGILLLETEEVVALADGIPERHWVWITARVASRATEYEEGALKKAPGGRSHGHEGQGDKRQRS